MHFAVYTILKNSKLRDFDRYKFIDDFSNKFCFDYDTEDDASLAENRICCLCDWFEIGGRWCDMFKATKGIKGDLDWMRRMSGEFGHINKNDVSVCEIDDLLEVPEPPYGFVVDDKYIEENTPEYNELVDAVANKTIHGVLVLLDCHE
jgi:hypothetical protein